MLPLLSRGQFKLTTKHYIYQKVINQVCMNNPYGTDLLLGELIPSTEIGTGTNKFRPGSSATAANTDTISFATI